MEAEDGWGAYLRESGRYGPTVGLCGALPGLDELGTACMGAPNRRGVLLPRPWSGYDGEQLLRRNQLLLLACVVIIYVRAIMLGPGGAQQLMWVLGALLLRTPASEDGGRK